MYFVSHELGSNLFHCLKNYKLCTYYRYKVTIFYSQVYEKTKIETFNK